MNEIRIECAHFEANYILQNQPTILQYTIAHNSNKCIIFLSNYKILLIDVIHLISPFDITLYLPFLKIIQLLKCHSGVMSYNQYYVGAV